MAYGLPSSSVTYTLTAGDDEEVGPYSPTMNGGGGGGGGSSGTGAGGATALPADGSGLAGGVPGWGAPTGGGRWRRVLAALVVGVAVVAAAAVGVGGVRHARSARGEAAAAAAEGGEGHTDGATSTTGLTVADAGVGGGSPVPAPVAGASSPAPAPAPPAATDTNAADPATDPAGAAAGAAAAAAPAFTTAAADRLPSGAVVPPAGQLAPRFTYAIVNETPTDEDAFTQGFFYANDTFFISTGNVPLPGAPQLTTPPDTSSMRRVHPATGEVLRKVTVGSAHFGEGSTLVGDKLAMISWKTHAAWTFDPVSLDLTGNWSYKGEGWGIAWDGDEAVYMSNGSSTIQVLHASNYTTGLPVRTFQVTNAGMPIRRLNELEVVCGELWANVWLTTIIVRIDPATGRVVGSLDLKGLLTRMTAAGVWGKEKRLSGGAVLNGIAWDRGGRPAAAVNGTEHSGGAVTPPRLWVTGKWWPRVFEITVDDPAVDWGGCAALKQAGLP
ncbi:hypothetical protein MMPV_000730 [Pyropia vietnamensis]